MDSKFFAMAALALAVSPASFAAGPFDGTYVQAGIGINRGSTHVTDGGNGFDGTQSAIRAAGQISVGSSQSYEDFFNLAVGAFYVVGKRASGQQNQASGTASYKQTNTMGITIEPGLNLGTRSLVYTKIGYVKTTLDVTISDPVSGSGNDGIDYDGIVYGLGAKYKLTNAFYGMAEIQQFVFNKKEEIKPASFGAFIGVGYQF